MLLRPDGYPVWDKHERTEGWNDYFPHVEGASDIKPMDFLSATMKQQQPSSVGPLSVGGPWSIGSRSVGPRSVGSGICSNNVALPTGKYYYGCMNAV